MDYPSLSCLQIWSPCQLRVGGVTGINEAETHDKENASGEILNVELYIIETIYGEFEFLSWGNVQGMWAMYARDSMQLGNVHTKKTD